MLIATTWEQTPYHDPTNPNQQVREAMVGTGGDPIGPAAISVSVPRRADQLRRDDASVPRGT